MDASSDRDVIFLRMTSAEALVLFEWLKAHEDREVRLDHLISDPAERAVLWSIGGALESLLVEPFQADYADKLEAARAELRPGHE